MNGRRTRVVYICQHLDVGGAEELIAAYMRRLPERGFEVGTICLTRAGRIAREIEASGARFWLLPGEPGPRDPLAFLRLVRLLRALRPDVVHTFLLVAGLYGRLAALLAGVPVIVATEANVYARKAPRHIWLERLLGPFTWRVVASSKAVQQFASRQTWVPIEKMPVLYNAIDFEALAGGPSRAEARVRLGLGADELVVGCIGRLTEQKGYPVLLDAFALVAPRFPEARLVVVGDGPDEPRLRQQVAALNLGERVRLLGVRRDLATIFAALDVFALASRWEGLPLAALEAMGCGLPVVTTAVGGSVEAIESGESGLLVPPGDAAAFAAALARLLGDPELRQRLGQEARARSRARFGLEVHLERLARLYCDGLAGSPGDPSPGVPLMATGR